MGRLLVEGTRRAPAAFLVMALTGAAVAVAPRAAWARPEGCAVQLSPLRLQLDSAASRVWFDGTSTFGSFTATTNSLDGWAELPENGLAGARGEVRMRPATLRTGIGLRDRHLRQELDTDRFPLITLSVERVSASARDAAGESAVVIEGALTVKGQTHPVSFSGTAALRADTLAVRARAALTFTGLGMKPPTRMFGATRVHDDFVLRFEGRFLPGRAAAQRAPAAALAASTP